MVPAFRPKLLSCRSTSMFMLHPLLPRVLASGLVAAAGSCFGCLLSVEPTPHLEVRLYLILVFTSLLELSCSSLRVATHNAAELLLKPGQGTCRLFLASCCSCVAADPCPRTSYHSYYSITWDYGRPLPLLLLFYIWWFGNIGIRNAAAASCEL